MTTVSDVGLVSTLIIPHKWKIHSGVGPTKLFSKMANSVLQTMLLRMNQ